MLAELRRSGHYGFWGAGEASYRADGFEGAAVGMRYFDYYVQCFNLRMADSAS